MALAQESYRIGELAARLGLTERTIRYYEELGLLESVKRVEGGRRVYAADDLRRLKFIQKLKVLGLTLQEMLELERLYRRHRSNRDVLPRLMELLDAHIATTTDRMNELAALRDEIRSYREHVAQRLLQEGTDMKERRVLPARPRSARLELAPAAGHTLDRERFS